MEGNPESRSNDAAAPPEHLFHISLNEQQATTIVLLHGLGSSHREWASITPHLSNYHLLIPDLPRHSGSKHAGPYTLANVSEQVARMVRAFANGSACHIVGFSAGGFVSVELAHRYPELVKSLFISGVYSMESKRRLLSVARYLMPPINAIQHRLPLAVTSYFAGFEYPLALLEDGRANNSFTLSKEGWAALLALGEGYPLTVRTLAVAATKHDDVEGTRKLGQLLRKGNERSMAVSIEGVHCWGLGRPELFARTISAWVEEEELVEEFMPLK